MSNVPTDLRTESALATAAMARQRAEWCDAIADDLQRVLSRPKDARTVRQLGMTYRRLADDVLENAGIATIANDERTA